MRLAFLTLIAVWAAYAASASAQESQRVALVIGNGAYEREEWRLDNPQNDAREMALLLDTLGFDVLLSTDADRAEMERLFIQFGERLANAGENTVSFVYYAGHGVQHDGDNLLVPIDADARTIDTLRFQAPAANFLFGYMQDAGNLINIMVLDACRDLPMPDERGARSAGGQGLAPIIDTAHLFVGYAASSGQTAADGDSVNSPYTGALLASLRRSADQPLSLVFSDVTQEVYRATDRAQRPEYRDGLTISRWSILTGAPSGAASANGTPGPVSEEDEESRERRLAALRQFGHRQRFQDCRTCPEMVALLGGTFEMGAEDGERDERPVRSITLAPFAIAETETTFDDWEACVYGGGCSQLLDVQGWGRGDQPVYNVSWAEAKTFAAWLSRSTNRAYRLPTEAEWEYAARASAATPYPTGYDTPSGVVNCMDCRMIDHSGVRPAQARSGSMNAFGLYHTLGNLAEWVEDCYRRNLENVGANGEAYAPQRCSHRVTRGGSFVKGALHSRHSSRERVRATMQNFSVGFRVAADLPDGVRAD